MQADESVITTKVFEPCGAAENFLLASGAAITHKGGRAFYRPSTDEIYVPPREAFTTPENYYATVLHELTHWTGHASRLDRNFSKTSRFGDESYAFEELVAELGAAFLVGHFGFVAATVENHASYMASWIKVLKNDKNAIFTAAKHAGAAMDYLLDIADKTVDQRDGYKIAA
nr:zincin-like metallopeptidase domain-containing protein [Pusillimonas minor]